MRNNTKVSSAAIYSGLYELFIQFLLPVVVRSPVGCKTNFLILGLSDGLAGRTIGAKGAAFKGERFLLKNACVIYFLPLYCICNRYI